MKNRNTEQYTESASEREALRALHLLADDPELEAPRHLTQHILAKLPRARKPLLSPFVSLFTFPRLALATVLIVLVIFASRVFLTRTAPRLVDETSPQTPREETTPKEDGSDAPAEHIAQTDWDKELDVLLSLSDDTDALFEDAVLTENPYASADDDLSYDEELL